MPLAELACNATKPKKKSFKLADGGGLYLALKFPFPKHGKSGKGYFLLKNFADGHSGRTAYGSPWTDGATGGTMSLSNDSGVP